MYPPPTSPRENRALQLGRQFLDVSGPLVERIAFHLKDEHWRRIDDGLIAVPVSRMRVSPQSSSGLVVSTGVCAHRCPATNPTSVTLFEGA